MIGFSHFFILHIFIKQIQTHDIIDIQIVKKIPIGRLFRQNCQPATCNVTLKYTRFDQNTFDMII